jgi:hypothetical protein
MVRDSGALVPEATIDPLTPELAPFVALARADLERATDGLDHDDAVEHLEAAVTRAAVAASRLGMQLPAAEPSPALTLGDGSVVLVQRIGDGIDDL